MVNLAVLLVAFLLTSVSLTRAGTPTDAYLAIRDKEVAALAGLEYTDASEEMERLALEALDPMIRSLVGPVHIPGFLPPGKPNVDQISGGTSFGKLDGMRLPSTDGKAFMIVSTILLLDAWRKATVHGHPDPFRQPGDFITSAVANDASAEVVARIPVVARGVRDRAGAVLMLFAQDVFGGYLPRQVAVSVVRGGRMFLIIEDIAAAPIPECASTDHYGACLSSHAPAQPWFRRISERSQALVDLVSSTGD